MKWFLVGSLCLLCSSSWARADAAADLYNQGNNDLDNQKFDAAAQAFQTILTSYPTFQLIDEAHIQAGQAYLYAGKFDEAVAALQKETDANAKPEYRAQALFLSALAQFSAAQKNSKGKTVDTSGYTKAAATLSTLIGYIAANATADNKAFVEQALYYRSLAYYEINQYDEAAADLIKLTTDPTFADSLSRPDYILQLGEIYAVETNDAVQDKKSPDAVTAAANKAIATFDEAINDPNALVQANEASKAKAQVFMLLAQLNNSSDSYQKALDTYRKVRRKADLIPEQQQRIDDLRKKEQQLVSQLIANPGLRSSVNQLQLLITREQGKLDSLQSAPDPIIDALIGIAQCYVSLTGPDGRKESDEARTILHRLNKTQGVLTPDQQQSVDFYILFSYVLGGQTDKADTALNDYLTKHAGDPNADFISYQISTELMKRKDYAGALKQAQRSLHDFAKGRYAAQATTLEAQALTALGRIPESNQVVDEFLKNNPTSPEAYAMILSRGNNEADAGDLNSAAGDFGKVKDATAAGAETQAIADLEYIQTLAKLQKFDQVITEAKTFETKYPENKQLAYVELFAAQALDQKHDPGAVVALQAVARAFPQDPVVAPLALYYVVDNYHHAGNVPLMVQAAKDLQAACPNAYTQIILADNAVSEELQKQKKFDDAATLYEPLTTASDPAVAADARNKIGDVRLAQAKTFHYQSLPPDQRPAAEKVLTSAEDAYLATLKNSSGQLNAIGAAIDGLINVAKQRHSWGILKEDTDYEPYLSQVSEGLTSPEMQARFEMAKAGLVFVTKNGATQYPAALDRFEKVTAANPGLRLTRQEADQFGDLLLAAKDYDGAKRVYQQLLDNSAATDAVSLAIAYYGLGAVALAQGDLPQAKDYFVKMESLPGGALWSRHILDANYGIALADETSGTPTDIAAAKALYGALMKSAAQQYRTVIATQAMLGYGRILEKQGNALKPAPEGPNEYAVHYYLQPNIMYFTGAPEQSAEGLYRAGQVYDKAGDKANAKKQYQLLMATYRTLAPDWAAKVPADEAQ